MFDLPTKRPFLGVLLVNRSEMYFSSGAARRRETRVILATVLTWSVERLRKDYDWRGS
jgi:hypothetical protein